MKPAAIVFDLFGTLLEIGSLETAAARHFADPRAFVATWREKQLAYAFAATIMDRYEDFDRLTARALTFAARRHGAADAGRGWESLGQAWREVAPYPDAEAALAQLWALGIPCLVLTNGTPPTAAAALQRAGLSDSIATILSVDAVGAYKPDRRVYALATAHTGAPAERIVFVTSNGWDATGAAEFGLQVAWCNRGGVPAETFGAPPRWTIRDLRDVAGLVSSVEN